MHVGGSRGLWRVRQLGGVVPRGARIEVLVAEARVRMWMRLWSVGDGLLLLLAMGVGPDGLAVVRRAVGVRKRVSRVWGARIWVLRVVLCVVEHAG